MRRQNEKTGGGAPAFPLVQISKQDAQMIPDFSTFVNPQNCASLRKIDLPGVQS
jgi:hypothetical protein